MRAAFIAFLTDSLRWSNRAMPRPSEVAVAALGVGGPIVIGAATGHLAAGMAASVGGLALSGGGSGGTVRAEAASLLRMTATGCLAVYAGIESAGHGVLTAGTVMAMGALAGLFGGMSRSLALTAMRFVLFAIIASRLAEQGAAPFGTMVVFLTGALWTSACALLLRLLLPPAGQRPVRHVSLAAKWRRWRSSLAALAGWQYALRLGLCLGIAEAAALVWPHGHAYWIALTVAISVQRELPASLARTFQRVAGTVAGVLLGSLLLFCGLPAWSLPILVAVLAAARPVLRAGNYMAYATIMTPLIILLTELDRPPDASLLADRLAATVAGGIIAVVFGYLIWPRGGRAAAP